MAEKILYGQPLTTAGRSRPRREKKREAGTGGSLATVLSVLGLLTGLFSMVLGYTHRQIGQAEQRIATLEHETRRMEVSIEHRLTRIEGKLDGLRTAWAAARPDAAR
jgi:hypothetical protein